MLSLLKLLFILQFQPWRHFWSVMFMSCIFMSGIFMRPAAISCPAILMVRHFHVQHFQSTRYFVSVNIICSYLSKRCKERQSNNGQKHRLSFGLKYSRKITLLTLNPQDFLCIYEVISRNQYRSVFSLVHWIPWALYNRTDLIGSIRFQ